jgi:rod shape-determining protein MreC
MRAEMQRLQLRNRELESQNAEAQRLASLLAFRDSHPEIEMLAAEVIGSSSDSSSHTLFINRGKNDGVKENFAVITPEGVIGKIVELFPNSAQVLLINDKDSGVGALFATTRTHGVVRGSGDPEPHMDYIIDEEKVEPGEIVVTSGEDRIFPKDLFIGTVKFSKPGTPFQTIQIAPAARLDRLEDVIVLMTQRDLQVNKKDDISGAAAKQADAEAAKVEAAKLAAANAAAADPNAAATAPAAATAKPTQTAQAAAKTAPPNR